MTGLSTNMMIYLQVFADSLSGLYLVFNLHYNLIHDSVHVLIVLIESFYYSMGDELLVVLLQGMLYCK